MSHSQGGKKLPLFLEMCAYFFDRSQVPASWQLDASDVNRDSQLNRWIRAPRRGVLCFGHLMHSIVLKMTSPRSDLWNVNLITPKSWLFFKSLFA